MERKTIKCFDVNALSAAEARTEARIRAKDAGYEVVRVWVRRVGMDGFAADVQVKS